MNIPGTLYIISAPSGGGKTSLVNALLKSVPNLDVSISYTTRRPRLSEKEGIDYYFTNEATFNRYVQTGFFLEYATVFHHHYGTSFPWIKEKTETGTDVILEIDWQGARQVREKFPESIGIFILPPSWDILEKRLRDRAQDEKTVIEQRMLAAKNELTHYYEYDYLIVNENFSQALSDLKAILRAQRLRNVIQKKEHSLLLGRLLDQPLSNRDK